MVSVCAGCNSYYPWISAGIAFVAGVIYVSISLLMVKLKIDDPLDAVAVHAGAGNTLYIFEEKYSLKNTLLNVLPYEQAS